VTLLQVDVIFYLHWHPGAMMNDTAAGLIIQPPILMTVMGWLVRKCWVTMQRGAVLIVRITEHVYR